MAHVERRAQGRWRARYRGPDGRERSKTFQRRVDAERWLASQEVARARGEWVDPALGRRTLAEWTQRWLELVEPTLKPSTAESYRSLLRSRILPALGARQLATLKPSDVQQLVGELQAAGLSASRIRQAHVVLSRILDAAARDGLVARNVAAHTALPRLQRREVAFFDPATVERIGEAQEPPYDLLVRLLGSAGLRWGEAAALRRGAVDVLRRRLLVRESASEVGGHVVVGPTKSHATRSVVLPPSLAAALEKHLDESVAVSPRAYVFSSPEGGPLRHSSFYHRRWRPALAELGLPPVGLHVLRHSAAAEMIAAGASPKALQVTLGHASASFSLTTYGHVFDADLEALASALDDRMTARREPPAASPRPGDGLRAMGGGA